MTNFKVLSIAFLFTGLLFLTSCGSDADCDDPNVFSELNSLSGQLIDLTFNFNNDPSDVDACNELVNLLNELVDESQNVQDCVPTADRAQFDSDLQQLEDSLDDLNCG